LVSVIRNAQFGAFELGESKPKRLQRFTVGGKNYEMAFIKIQILDLDAFFVRPWDRFPFVDSERERFGIIFASG
jgi:hypothetical protein